MVSEAHLIYYQRSLLYLPQIALCPPYRQLTIHHDPFNRESSSQREMRREGKKLKINLANARKISINFVFQTVPLLETIKCVMSPSRHPWWSRLPWWPVPDIFGRWYKNPHIKLTF